MTNVSDTATIEPPISEWDELLARSQRYRYPNALNQQRQNARQQLVESAEQYVLRLHARAVRAGLPTVQTPLLTGDPGTKSLVMTGHQPVIFHPGLVSKYELTETFSRQQQSICVAVVIDTDQGDCGQFVFPHTESAESPAGAGTADPDGFSVSLITDSLAQAAGLYLDGKLKSSSAIQGISRRIVSELRHSELSTAAERTEVVLQQYGQLADEGVSAMEANLILRWQHGIGGSCLELPLSALSTFRDVLAETVRILASADEFCAMYNRLLDQFRQEHSIRNTANPFPSLEQSADRCELPFWVINQATLQRRPLRVTTVGNQLELLADDQSVVKLPLSDLTGGEVLEPLLLEGIQLVPRGALITAFLRVLFSDLFVHGTGGGKYDRFTDMLIRSWWQVEPAPFTVASDSRYLLAEQRSRLHQLEDLATQLRELQFNPQRHFGSGIFSEGLEEQLRQLTAAKQAAIASMQATRAVGVSAKSTGREIQQLTNQIRDLVGQEFEPRLKRLKSLTPETRDAINCRTFPWFLF